MLYRSDRILYYGFCASVILNYCCGGGSVKKVEIMSKHIIIGMIFTSLIVIPATCNANIQIIEAEGAYTVSNYSGESVQIAREKAKNEAVRIALNKAGIYVESYSKIDDMRLTREEMRTITGKVIKIENEQYKVELIEDHKLKYTVSITAVIDTNNIMTQLERDKDQIRQLRDRNALLMADYEILKHENEKYNVFADYDLFVHLQKAMDSELAVDVRINSLDMIIQKNPIYRKGIAYALKASIYTREGNYSCALKCDLKYLDLNPSNAVAHYYCALDYQNLHDWPNAIGFIYLAISYDPENIVYQNAKNYILYEAKKYGVK